MLSGKSAIVKIQIYPTERLPFRIRAGARGVLKWDRRRAGDLGHGAGYPIKLMIDTGLSLKF
jgi:hypothetical protein